MRGSHRHQEPTDDAKTLIRSLAAAHDTLGACIVACTLPATRLASATRARLRTLRFICDLRPRQAGQLMLRRQRSPAPVHVDSRGSTSRSNAISALSTPPITKMKWGTKRGECRSGVAQILLIWGGARLVWTWSKKTVRLVVDVVSWMYVKRAAEGGTGTVLGASILSSVSAVLRAAGFTVDLTVEEALRDAPTKG